MRINIKNINKKKKKLQQVREELETSQMNAIRELITKEKIEQICEKSDYYYRRRKITPIVTLLHMIGAAISRERSFQSAWHNSGQIAGVDIICKARQRMPEKVWMGVDRWIEDEIEKEFGEQAKWRGHRLVGVDGTCVSMSDETELEEEFGKCGSKRGESRFPIARVVFSFTLKTQITLNHRIGTYKKSEQELFRGMLSDMKTGDLVICDRHFAGANLYVEYKRARLEFITPTHQRLNVDKLKRIKEYSEGDIVVKLPITPKHRRDDSSLPENIAVRLIEVKAKIRGKKKVFWLVTSLLDSKKYPAHEIKDLYKKRWKVEILIEEIKIWLGSDVLRSKTASGIYKELYARIIAGNLIHWLILKAAKKYKKDPGRISTTAATRLINCYTWKMSEASDERIEFLYEELLNKIASAIIPYRPNRLEPRLKRRDQKHYSILHTSRAQWRKDNGIDS